MPDPVLLVVISEADGWGAGALDGSGFAVFAPTRRDLAEKLNREFAARYGPNATFKVIGQPWPPLDS